MEPKASLTLEGKLAHRQLSDDYLRFLIGQVKLQKAAEGYMLLLQKRRTVQGGGGEEGDAAMASSKEHSQSQ